jgi:hypothetical protein
MGLDAPLAKREAAKLGAFLARHQLPPLQNTPFIGHMLFEEMRRIQKGQPPKYILFPAPAANRAEVEKERMRRYYLAHRAELLARARARHRANREARKVENFRAAGA